MTSLSIVIPALNEATNLPRVFETIPISELARSGWKTEVIVVDNGSTDGTGDVARRLGAKVVLAEARGYGNAYMAGFAAASGEIIATGDADCTYPFDHLPVLLARFVRDRADFLTTDRLASSHCCVMSRSHLVGNRVLSWVSRLLFRNDINDTQSGMWVFRRDIWPRLRVRSPGMAFSQEIKNAAWYAGLRCIEVPIEYRERAGDVKLNALRDGIRNLFQLAQHRMLLAIHFGRQSRGRDTMTGAPSGAGSLRPNLSQLVTARGDMVARTRRPFLAWFFFIALAPAALTPFSAEVKEELGKSFASRPAEYVELFFPTAPSFIGRGADRQVRVPVVLRQHGIGPAKYVIRVLVASSRSEGPERELHAVTATPGAHNFVFTLPVPANTRRSTVVVNLEHRGENLRYRVFAPTKPS